MPVRELNQDTAGVLARVERGETVEITRHGKVIGRIVPAGVGELDDWIAQGRVCLRRSRAVASGKTVSAFVTYDHELAAAARLGG